MWSMMEQPDKKPQEQPLEQGAEQPSKQRKAAHLVGHRWQKGQSGNPAGKRVGAPKAPGMLKAMRWVVTHAETSDKNQLQRECRAWLKENRQGFMTKLADLEKAYLTFLASQGRAKEQTQPAPES